MPKSNRKGYFVMKLRSEGLDVQEKYTTQANRKGIRKLPKTAAKQARQRKKIYISHLQKRIDELLQEIQLLKKQKYIPTNTQTYPVYSCPANNNNNPNNQKQQKQKPQKPKRPSQDPLLLPITQQSISKARFEGLIKQITNLSKNIQKNNRQQVCRSLSVLRDKYGISGRQRLKYIDEQFQKIVNIMMPMHYRLLMQNSLNNRQFYTLLGSQYTNTKSHQHLIKLEQRQRQILLNVRPQIIKQRQEYDNILGSMAELRNRIKTQNYKCQGIVDQIEERVDPIFVGRLLLDLDLRRSKENLEEIYPINYWVKIKGEVCEFGGNKYATGGYGGHGGHGGQKKMDNSQVNKDNIFIFQDDMEIVNSLFS